MFLYAYKHRGGDNFPLVTELPTDPDGYSHQMLNAYEISPGFAQSKFFYCSFLLGGVLLAGLRNCVSIARRATTIGSFTLQLETEILLKRHTTVESILAFVIGSKTNHFGQFCLLVMERLGMGILMIIAATCLKLPKTSGPRTR